MQRFGRRAVTSLVVPTCVLVLVHAFVLTPVRVPTGSMAPTLLGVHRRIVCPSCGAVVVVGADEASSRKAFCGNCGQAPLAMAAVPASDGDQLLVNRLAFALRSPRRWEIAVFHWLGQLFIKRIVGLPGESIALHEGDVYINGQLARKTLAEARRQRVLIHDAAFTSPAGSPWHGGTIADATHILDGGASPCVMEFRVKGEPSDKCDTLGDELEYNGGAYHVREAVHDFFLEANLVAEAGQGTLRVALNDGGDEVEVVIPWTKIGARVGMPVHLEAALVDRRLSVALDGRLVQTQDLPATPKREAVSRPVRLTAEGLRLRFDTLRLWRDVHYQERGRNAVHGAVVRLGAEQYFVLGDNSPVSDDSREWSDEGRVDGANLLGAPLLVHLPSQAVTLPGSPCCQLPDLSRIRRP